MFIETDKLNFLNKIKNKKLLPEERFSYFQNYLDLNPKIYNYPAIDSCFSLKIVYSYFLKCSLKKIKNYKGVYKKAVIDYYQNTQIKYLLRIYQKLSKLKKKFYFKEYKQIFNTYNVYSPLEKELKRNILYVTPQKKICFASQSTKQILKNLTETELKKQEILNFSYKTSINSLKFLII